MRPAMRWLTSLLRAVNESTKGTKMSSHSQAIGEKSGRSAGSWSRRLSLAVGGLALSTVLACGAGSDEGSGTAGTNGAAGKGGSGTTGVAGTMGQAGQTAGTSGQAGTGGGQAGTGGSATGTAGTTGVAGTTGTAGAAGSGNPGSGGNAGAAGTAGRGGAMGGPGGRGGGGATSGAGGSSAGTGGATGGAGRGGSGGAAMGGRGGGAAGSGGGATGTGGSGTPGMSSGCGKPPTIASSMYNNGQHISITVGTMQRRYILNVPTNYDNTKPYKLIIAYHELNGNDDEMYRNQYYHLLPLSNNSAIFVAPNGQQNNASCTQASGCGWPNPQNTDLALADAVVAQIEQNFCVDTNRIFATGWSYGGSMSYKTACERPLGGVANGFVRAIAVYSGSQLSGNCTPSKPVGYYASHGTGDSVLPYNSGVGLFQNFAKANGCTYVAPPSSVNGAHVCNTLMGCTSGYPTEFCAFSGDHTPDPKDSGQSTSWEYQNVWTYFSQF
jgi:poly(3-hydroxybutyrate) depolymerase